MKRPVIVTARKPKRRTEPAPARTEPLPVIVTTRKPGKARLRLQDPPSDEPVSEEVREFFARMIRPPGA